VTEAALQPIEYRPGSAWTSHGPFAMWLVSADRPRTVVELGTQHGYSLFAFCQAARDWGTQTQVFGVDTWIGDEHAGYYGPQVYATAFDHARRTYPESAHLLRMTFDEARERFEPGSIDLLHIDGLHTYDAAMHDLQTWLPAMSERGVVIMHDTAVRRAGFGVWRLWEEVRDDFPSFAFEHGHGLGVLVVGDRAGDDVRALTALAEREARQVREVYQALGRRWEWSAAIDQRFREATGVAATITATRNAARAETDAVKEQLRVARGRAARAEEALRLVEESTIWRATRPYRDGRTALSERLRGR
jgi:hypothetical protein